jgi:zinc protease
MTTAYQPSRRSRRRFHHRREWSVTAFISLAVLATQPVQGKPQASISNVGSTATSANPHYVKETRPVIKIPFEKYQLPNGLEVILHEDHSLPLTAVSVWYHVGPVNEPPKRSGFAHLFEHLMFAGSKHVGGQFDELLESVGATNVNGTTSWDRTNYFETLPREYLELALWIESDRMGFLLDAIDQNALDTQRDVVKNERRQSFENAPYGPSSLTLMDTLFPEGHPYHGAVIGSMADLSAATLDDVRAFYQDYYAPSNATLALAGDIDTRQAKAWIEKYFSTLRKVPKPQSGDTPTIAPPQSARLEVKEPVHVPRVAFGWVTPAAYKAQSEAMELAAELLAGGKASRLYRSLVVDKKLASDVNADADGNALGTLFSVEAFAATGVSTSRLEDALVIELANFSKQPPADDELRRAKSRILLSVTRELQALNGHGGESGRIGQLQRFNHYFHDPGALEQWYERVWAVKASDVSTACAQWLAPDHRVTVITQSKDRGHTP